MPHPKGGKGNVFTVRHSFQRAYEYIGANGITFNSTTGERISAIRGESKDVKTIVFLGEKSRHGNVCENCWGYRQNCSGTRIGQCSEALDSYIR